MVLRGFFEMVKFGFYYFFRSFTEELVFRLETASYHFFWSSVSSAQNPWGTWRSRALSNNKWSPPELASRGRGARRHRHTLDTDCSWRGWRRSGTPGASRSRPNWWTPSCSSSTLLELWPRAARRQRVPPWASHSRSTGRSARRPEGRFCIGSWAW